MQLKNSIVCFEEGIFFSLTNTFASAKGFGRIREETKKKNPTKVPNTIFLKVKIGNKVIEIKWSRQGIYFINCINTLGKLPPRKKQQSIVNVNTGSNQCHAPDYQCWRHRIQVGKNRLRRLVLNENIAFLLKSRLKSYWGATPKDTQNRCGGFAPF